MNVANLSDAFEAMSALLSPLVAPEVMETLRANYVQAEKDWQTVQDMITTRRAGMGPDDADFEQAKKEALESTNAAADYAEAVAYAVRKVYDIPL